MSTTGSARNSGPLAPGASAPTSPQPATPVAKPAKGFFRWRGIFALLFFAAVAMVGWVLFADMAIKSSIAEAATKSLGVEVEIDKLHLSLTEPSLDIRGLTVAHPSDSMLNVIEVGHARVQLDGAPALRAETATREVLEDGTQDRERKAS